ncbi:Tn3 family transposase [Streptomyces sp. ISL-1]|uniref:Tn3 family transposase n=1 Tax=Streptomyces sp. ISL-1 TaxID=2817657 RepID=UPI0035ABA87B
MIRTVQLPRYLSDAPLRSRVTAATNKFEAFNGFSDRVRFSQRGVHVAGGQPGDLPQHPGHRGRGPPAPGRGLDH